MSNGINEFSPEIRDFLLNRNLILSDTVTKNGLSASASGLGRSVDIQSSSPVLPSINIEESGIDFRNNSVLNNKYVSSEDMVSATLINNSSAYSQIDGGYIDRNKRLNLGGSSSTGLDILTSLTSNEGFGLGSDGFIPQNKINSSITGRVLGGVGAINDTPLGIIGGQQLLLALAQRTSFNAQKDVNLNPFDLVKGGKFFNTDYSITNSNPTNNKILNRIIDLTGFETSFTKFDMGVDIISKTPLKGSKIGSSFNNTITVNNIIIENTGKGQVERLIESLNYNYFQPKYESEKFGLKVERTVDGVTSVATEYEKVDDFNTVFVGGLTEGDVTWDPSINIGNGYDNEQTLLTKTKKLFNGDSKSNFIGGDLYKSLFNLQGIKDIKKNNSITTPAKNDKLSKGSGVVSDNEFCRVWDSKNPYSSVGNLQKNSGLYNTQTRVNDSYLKSILGSNGFPKISPYKTPENGESSANAKKFMFSIENLAWNDSLDNLAEYEIGVGDETTGTKGRIMWFPPYDIKFSESTNVNWDKTSFIGRGEPIYTYNNTERSGNLSFKVIIDHPDYLNNTNLYTDGIIDSLLAGCSDVTSLFSTNEISEIENQVGLFEIENIISNTENKKEKFYIYFPNDSATIPDSYEDGIKSTSEKTISDGGFFSEAGTEYVNYTDFDLNGVWREVGFIENLKKLVKNNDNVNFILTGSASKAGTKRGKESVDNINVRLSESRIEWVKTWLKENIGNEVKIINTIPLGSKNATSTSDDVDSESIKKDRHVKVEYYIDISKDKEIKASDNERINNIKKISRRFNSDIRKRFFNESRYFEEMGKSDEVSDKFIYKSFKEKIKFFHPSFHSTTPEGFNSRLTFINQCTRQGATKKGLKSKNLAFGAPPVCILRIGDFYNTKIIINNVNLNFEPLVWDLNPEGVGVQPMIANVELGFNFIGGSSLEGPINRLQNAVSFNYFANSEIYDPRADRLRDTSEVPKSVNDTETLTRVIEEKRDVLQNLIKNNNTSNQILEPKSNRGHLENLRVVRLIKTDVLSKKLHLVLFWGALGTPIGLTKSFIGDVTIINKDSPNMRILVGKIKIEPVDGGVKITPITNGLIGEQILTTDESTFEMPVAFDLDDITENIITESFGDTLVELNWKELKVKSIMEINNVIG